MIDTLNQSSNQEPLPSDLQARIDNAKNNLSVFEAESTRLQKLTVTETNKILALKEEEVFIKAKIDNLKDELNSVLNETADRTVFLVGLKESVSLETRKLSDIKDEVVKHESKIVSDKADLDKREESIKYQEQSVNERNLDLIKRETDHNAKVEKLKRAIE